MLVATKDPTSKDPAKVRAGRASARKRWADHTPRSVVRIADLAENERRLVMALIRAAREAA